MLLNSARACISLHAGLRPSQSSSVHVDGGQQPLQAAIHNGYTAPGAVVWGCNTLTRGVALTFDDGPNPNTATLLKNLKLLGVKVT
jgi:peptidoglycan/xylan/chitin deacetylase (PgdA/CDA1 family)